VHRAPSFSETQHQTAIAARVVRIILNQLALCDYVFHFIGAYHPLGPLTSDESREVETKTVFALLPERLLESPSITRTHFKSTTAIERSQGQISTSPLSLSALHSRDTNVCLSLFSAATAFVNCPDTITPERGALL
jgi:hypothetical protein